MLQGKFAVCTLPLSYRSHCNVALAIALIVRRGSVLRCMITDDTNSTRLHALFDDADML